jgi:AraC-like DNA-binding protein
LMVNNALLVIGIFLSMILSIILLRQGRWQILGNRLLVFYLAALGMACFMSFVITNKVILSIPWLFRLPSPVFYWMFPAGFLYVWTTVHDRSRLPGWAWLLFIPGLIHLVEMMPFYLLSIEEKRHILESEATKPLKGFKLAEGWLRDYQHNFVRGVWCIILSLGAIVILWPYRKQERLVRNLYPGMYRFLWVFTLMMLFFGLMLAITFYQAEQWSNPMVRSRLLTISFSSSLIVVAVYLFLFPGYLYGMPRISGEQTSPADEESMAYSDERNSQLAPSSEIRSEELGFKLEASSESSMDPGLQHLYASYLKQVTDYMEDKKPFLRADYKIADLSRETGIPQYHLSTMLNKMLNMRFTDFLNQHRIRYAQELVLRDGPIHNLEGLASLCGFSNRITFNRAVQKMTGEAPSRYFYKDIPEHQAPLPSPED